MCMALLQSVNEWFMDSCLPQIFRDGEDFSPFYKTLTVILHSTQQLTQGFQLGNNMIQGLLLCPLQGTISLEGSAMEPQHIADTEAVHAFPLRGVCCVVASTLEHFLEKLRYEAFKLKQNLRRLNTSYRLFAWYNQSKLQPQKSILILIKLIINYKCQLLLK